MARCPVDQRVDKDADELDARYMCMYRCCLVDSELSELESFLAGISYLHRVPSASSSQLATSTRLRLAHSVKSIFTMHPSPSIPLREEADVYKQDDA